MKILIYTLITGAAVLHTFGQAQLGAYPWLIKLKVIDDNAHPVKGAKAWVGYDAPKKGQSTDPFQSGGWAIAGLTDTNGLFIATHTDRSWTLGINVEKSGYYPTHVSYELYVPGQLDSQKVATNRNPNITLPLKKIDKPIAMYAKHIANQPPANEVPVGYDLEIGDWVAPYGNGIDKDIFFTRDFHRKSFQDYDYRLTVSFPNPEDGIQEFSVPYKNMEGSRLRSPHEAPTNGYLPQIVRLNISHPGQKLIFDYDENRAYFFRVRTKVDDRGNIVSAHYGKIYGDFMNFTYYLNPTPNDRNIEFDPKQNLIKNLPPLERVSAP